MTLNIQLDTTSTPKLILEPLALTRGKYALFSFFISMPEHPPQLPSWSGALGFPRACSELSHFSSLFCCSMVYPWEFTGSVPSEVLFEVQGLGVAFLCRSRGALGTTLLLGQSHCSCMSHSSPPHCWPPWEERPLYRCHFCLQSFRGFPPHAR